MLRKGFCTYSQGEKNEIRRSAVRVQFPRIRKPPFFFFFFFFLFPQPFPQIMENTNLLLATNPLIHHQRKRLRSLFSRFLLSLDFSLSSRTFPLYSFVRSFYSKVEVFRERSYQLQLTTYNKHETFCSYSLYAHVFMPSPLSVVTSQVNKQDWHVQIDVMCNKAAEPLPSPFRM